MRTFKVTMPKALAAARKKMRRPILRARKERPVTPCTRAERMAQFEGLNECQGFRLRANTWFAIARADHSIRTDFSYIMGELDTIVREQMLDGVARMALGERWPCGRDGLSHAQFNLFEKDLFKACQKKGMTVRGAKLDPAILEYVPTARRRRRRRTSRARRNVFPNPT